MLKMTESSNWRGKRAGRQELGRRLVESRRKTRERQKTKQKKMFLVKKKGKALFVSGSRVSRSHEHNACTGPHNISQDFFFLPHLCAILYLVNIRLHTNSQKT